MNGRSCLASAALRTCAAGLIALSGSAAAGDLSDLAPFPVINHSPFALLYGVPAPREVRLLPAGSIDVRLTTALASHYQIDSHSAETLTLDGETRRTSFDLRGGFGRGMEWTIELSRVGHDAGLLDGFIENWHDFFGLPQGGRDLVPRDQLLFHYRRDGVDRIRLTEPVSGTGDARVGLGMSLGEDASSPLALRAEIKLPSGNSDDLTGSGARDLAISLATACRIPSPAGWCYYGGAGLAYLGPGDALPELQRRKVLFADIGVAWRALPTITFKAQLDAQGAIFRSSQLDALGNTAAQIALGGVWRATKRMELEFVVLEDAAVRAAPDVTLQASMRARF